MITPLVVPIVVGSFYALVTPSASAEVNFFFFCKVDYVTKESFGSDPEVDDCRRSRAEDQKCAAVRFDISALTTSGELYIASTKSKSTLGDNLSHDIRISRFTGAYRHRAETAVMTVTYQGTCELLNEKIKF